MKFNLKKKMFSNKTKFLLAALASTSFVIGACAPSFQKTQPKKDPVVTKLNDSTILKLKSGELSYKDLTEQFLKTPTGAKTFGKAFINLLIYRFYETLLSVNLTASSLDSARTNELLAEWGKIEKEVNDKLKELEKTKDKETEEDKNKKIQTAYDVFGGNKERYKIFNSLEKLKENFLNELTKINYLNYANQETIDLKALNDSANWSKIQFSNESLTDPLAKTFANFQQFLFDDWFKNEKPVPVVKVTWKYADKDVKDKNGNPILESIYDKDALLQKGFSLPEKADYKFPAFADENTRNNLTGQKFKNFINNLDSLTPSTGLNRSIDDFSEEQNDRWKVYKLADLGTNENSSQDNAAVLNLYNKLINDNETVVNETAVANLDTKYLLKNFLEVKTNENIAEANINKHGILVDGNDLFKDTDNIKIGQDAAKSKPNFVKDYITIKSSDNKHKWILIKDDKGMHAISFDGIGKALTAANQKEKEIVLKQIILDKALRNKLSYNSENNAKYDLMEDLKSYLTKNFESILLRYLSEQFKNSDNDEYAEFFKSLNSTSPTIDNYNKFNANLFVKHNKLFGGLYNPLYTWKEFNKNKTNFSNLINKMADLFTAQSYTGKLFSLRQKLVSSYKDFIKTDVIKIGDKFYPDVKNGLASKLPFELAYSQTVDVNNYTNYSQDNDGGYKDLEKIYFSNEEEVFKKYFDPNAYKNNYEAYQTALKTFLDGATFKFDFVYDSDELKNLSKALHYANDKNKEADKLSQIIDQPKVMEFTMVYGFENKDLSELIKNQILQTEVVNKYFDDQKYEIKSFDLPSNTPNNFKDKLSSNYLLLKNKPLFLNEVSKQIWGGFKKTDNSFADFLKLLNKINYQQNFVNTTNGFDFLGLESKKNNSYFLTLDWLVKNNFSNFKNYLKTIVSQYEVGSFVWVNENKQSISINPNFGQKPLSNEAANKLDYAFNTNPQNIIDSPYILNKPFAAVSNFNNQENNWSFADIKLNDATKTEINAVGYKGLFTSKNSNELGNVKISDSLFKDFQSANGGTKNVGALFAWNTKKDLIELVKSIKNEAHLKQITDNLAKAFPDVSFENVARKEIKSPLENSQTQFLNLKQKINALLNILYGYNYVYRTDTEQIFEQSVTKIYNTTPTTENSEPVIEASERINNEAFQRFQDSLKNGIPNSTNQYLFKTDDTSLTGYVAYAVQVNYNDFADDNSFAQFMNRVSADVFLQELFKAAQNEQNQKAALFAFLNVSPFTKIVAYDIRMYNNLGQDWSEVKKEANKG